VTKKKTLTVLHTIMSDIEPLTEDERKKLSRKRNKSIRKFVLDELFVASLDDNDIAEDVCILAGILSHSSEPLKILLEEEMKLGPRWSNADLIMAWIDYAYFLEEEGGSERKARKRLIQKEEKRIGKKIKDGTMANLLTLAVHTISLERFPEYIHSIIKKRLARGEKTMHRGLD